MWGELRRYCPNLPVGACRLTHVWWASHSYLDQIKWGLISFSPSGSDNDPRFHDGCVYSQGSPSLHVHLNPHFLAYPNPMYRCCLHTHLWPWLYMTCLYVPIVKEASSSCICCKLAQLHPIPSRALCDSGSMPLLSSTVLVFYLARSQQLRLLYIGSSKRH